MKIYLFFIMSASKNPSKFKTTAFLLVKTQILSDFYELTYTFKLGNSLSVIAVQKLFHKLFEMMKHMN